jgi:hypothetical protein
MLQTFKNKFRMKGYNNLVDPNYQGFAVNGRNIEMFYELQNSLALYWCNRERNIW